MMHPSNDELTAIKAELKDMIREITMEIKLTRKLHRLDDPMPPYVEAKLADLENKKSLYRKVIPVQVGGIIIDYKLYSQFVKKLKKFTSTEKIAGRVFIISYAKPFSADNGRLELADLSNYFHGFSQIPTAVMDEEDKS